MENSHHCHKAVMACEVIDFLRLEKAFKILDATVGFGGHAKLVMEKIGPQGLLVGVDCDEESLKIAKKELTAFGNICALARANFSALDDVLQNLGVEQIDGAIFDLGISSYQMGCASRGFSFMREGFLDMRADLSAKRRAWDIVNKCRKEDLERIIRDFGEERHYRRITAFIREARIKSAINTTEELSSLIKRAVGKKYASQRIHPATRTFQALRIAVNNELDNLTAGLEKVISFLGAGRRVCVISFHSLEDRIVKHKFKGFQKSGLGRIITKKPVRAADSEIRENPRSRSAKLRVFEKDAK